MIGNDTGMPIPMAMSVAVSVAMSMAMSMNNPMEVMEDIEAREIEPGVPEWTGDPGIHVIIIPGRRIICHDRRAFGVIIIIDFRRLRILRSCRGWTFSVSLWHFSNDR
jgi:hypothetical protein